MNIAPLLQDAKASHDRIVEELTRVYDQLDENMKFDRFNDRVERLVVPFDLKLQFDLLKLALAGRKKEDSLAFLYGAGFFQYEILRYVKEYADVRGIENLDVTYQNILTISEEERARFLAIAKASIEPLWDDALKAISKADLVVERDAFQSLENHLLRFVDCFLMVDESVTETEIRKAVETVRVNMLGPIVEANDELFRRSEVK
jgi:hypothetical protein